MDTASFQFVAYGLAIAIISNLSRSRVWRSVVLMVASLVFLGLVAQNVFVLLPLAGFLLLGYFGLALLERGWSRPFVWILLIILVYVWLKQYTFLPARSFLHFSYLTLGLSYILFRVLHLLIDHGMGNEQRHVGLGAYLLYTLNFTTFVSGPIQRYDEFARDQYASEPVQLGARVVGAQLERIVRGFFKVNVLAMLFNMVRVDALGDLLQAGPPWMKFYAAFRLAVAYPLFLYANFSGYIDIVIALARLMRVRLPENFDRPFEASSVLDFWNRWHITLSRWLKTYVYNPLLLTLMRRVSSRGMQQLLGVLCYFVTFFLIGIWHGRTSEFVFFGVLTGAGMALNKLWQLGMTRALGRKQYRALANNFFYRGFGRGLNFVWFAFTLFWFWGRWPEIKRAFAALSLAHWAEAWLAAWLCAAAILTLWEWLRAVLLSIRSGGEPLLTSRYAGVVYASALGLAAFVVTVLLNQPAPGIVYRAF